jgi:hypothetical protein
MQQEVVTIRHASMSAFSSREVSGLLAAGALEYGRAWDGVLLTDGVGVDGNLIRPVNNKFETRDVRHETSP